MSGNREQCTMVLFGSTGDLARRKLYPALYLLQEKGELPAGFRLFAIGRKFDTRDAFLAFVRAGILDYAQTPLLEPVWNQLAVRIGYFQMDLTNAEAYQPLKEKLNAVDGAGNRFYYLATASRHFEPIVTALRDNHMHSSERGWRRIVIEKPFGRDLETAIRLNQVIRTAFDEEDTYRIDHYLGKEMTQNMLVLRRSNHVFNALWNAAHLDHIQITVAENMGIGSRGRYYDHAGAMRDMVQNHLLQVVALATMPLCDQNNPLAVREAKVRVLKSLKDLDHEGLHQNVVLGQYVGYTDEANVAEDSLTETFVAMKLEVDMPHMRGVPIYIRTGKHMARKEAHAVIQFKSSDPCGGRPEPQGVPNRLIVKIQPTEGVEFRFNVKEPGNTSEVREVVMDFCQTCESTYNSPEAYESLLYDAMAGDPTRFTSWGEVVHSWRYMNQIIGHCDDRKEWLKSYERGSWGPAEADRLIEQDNRKWWYAE